MEKVLFLIVGGSLGTLARYFLALGVINWLGPAFPYGTLAVNLLGCFLIGILAGLFEGYSTLNTSSAIRFFLMAGFLGAFTTFSTYEYESFLLIRQGALWKAVLNLGGSVILGLAALLIGYLFTRLALEMARASS